MANKNILLIEPGYKNKYPPLGLMKISQYHGPNGKRDRVRFIKGEDRSVLSEAWDRIYVTTLFSFEFDRISQSINFAKTVAGAATLALTVGVSPKVVSEQLGHTSAAFTLDVYSHVLPHMQDDAAAKVEAALMA